MRAAVQVIALGGATAVCVALTSCSTTAPAAPTAPPVPSATPALTSPTPTAATAAPTRTPTRSARPTPTRSVPSLNGDTDNALAYAPLHRPDRITVQGAVDDMRAWSTSKVVVIMAFLQEQAGGDPANLSQEDRDFIRLALSESDLNALLTLRGRISSPGAIETQILRSVGDRTTTFPDSNEGTAEWSPRNQIKFLTALHEGRVVSRRASRYVLAHMHPVPSESWGLGTIGSSAFKGGWYRDYTDTRQMGFVDGYAVVIITDGVGPVEHQIDGDDAHVQQLNKLARILKANL